MEKETIEDLRKRVRALEEMNNLLLQQAVETRKLLDSLGVNREQPSMTGDSSLKTWIV